MILGVPWLSLVDVCAAQGNRTGSVSVQVIDKSKGYYRVIKSFGTVRTEAEVVRLEEKARQYVRELTGTNRSLFEEEDDIKLENYFSTISNTQIQVIGPELIFGTLYDRVGYGRIENELFRQSVLALQSIKFLKTYNFQLR